MSGSPGYVPPELNFSDLPRAEKWKVAREVRLQDLKAVDSFAFGVLAAAFCTHNNPYEDPELGGMRLFEQVAQPGGLRPQPQPAWPEYLQSVVLDCVGDLPEPRPTFHDLRKGFQRELLEDRLPRCVGEVTVAE